MARRRCPSPTLRSARAVAAVIAVTTMGATFAPAAQAGANPHRVQLIQAASADAAAAGKAAAVAKASAQISPADTLGLVKANLPQEWYVGTQSNVGPTTDQALRSAAAAVIVAETQSNVIADQAKTSTALPGAIQEAQDKLAPHWSPNTRGQRLATQATDLKTLSGDPQIHTYDAAQAQIDAFNLVSLEPSGCWATPWLRRGFGGDDSEAEEVASRVVMGWPLRLASRA